ncbi:endonuclease/exonuclease/phosphatase family protein [Cellulosimicrobium cellulans]|uniref:endonuclease/exonuclease/phosphatase family protein n=1 Tax=Cellulosimicrobium cellulans TaxID=1710 RepID=UPI0020969F42|nr:endonuclease/exonuclease/phosphatase family protein [Cellulosimicrobium cellulans]MCO7272867.1 endonuclease/exonuclease/phosphatase family protein [Cellulosimicrobium cellulans]
MSAAQPPSPRPVSRSAARFDRATVVPLLLVVAVTAIVVELVRSSGPLLDHAFSAGVVTVALTALATYAAPGVLVVMIAARLELTGKVVLLAVASLVVARLVLQGLGAAIAAGADLGLVRYGVGLATVALGIGVLVLVAAFASGSPAGGADPAPEVDGASGRTPSRSGAPLARGSLVAVGVVLGALLAGALSAVLGTWDAYWRADVAGWVVTAVVAAGAVACAWALRGRAAWPGSRGLWVLGPFVALLVQALANPAFAASQTGVALPFAVTALAVAAVLAAWFVPWAGRATRRGSPWVSPALLVVGVAVVFLAVPRLDGPGTVGGWALLVLLVLLVPAAARTLALALTRGARPLTWLRLAGAASVAGLGIAVPLLGYQLEYDVPLPFPHTLVPVAAALALAVPAVVAGLRARGAVAPLGDPAASGTTTAAGLPGLPALAVGGAVAVLALVGVTQVHVPTTTSAVADQPVGDLRLLDWNLHYGVSADPSVRLDEMVATIEDSGADVVTLQEVSRGWVLGGGADMATFLARETGMRVVFVPAADRQFGNAILWDPLRGDLADVARHALPYGAGPQERSAVSATLDAAGVPVRVTSVHLQHREENTPTRLDQLGTLLADEPVEGAYVLAGDLNAEPGWDEITLVEEHGLESDQDAAGDPDALTSPAVAPAHRIDWVFGSDPVTFRSFEVLDVTASDHRPLLTELRTRD